jgi:RsiW-degrading membrane proteinase PrsW (M82 family)
MGGLACLVIRSVFSFLGLPNLYVGADMVWFSFLEKTLLFVLGLAFLEELAKFLILRFYAYHQKDFDEPIDGIIYGITVGLGFATCENIAQIITQGPAVIFSRFATATLLHALLGGLMGSFLAQGKFSFFKKCCLTIRALILCVGLHFVYNVFVLYDLTGLGFKGEIALVFGIFVVLMFIIIRIKNKARCRLAEQEDTLIVDLK